MERQAKLLVHEGRVVGQHRAGQAQLVVAGRAQEVELATGFAHQHIRAGDAGTAGEVKADKGNLARACGGDAAGFFPVLEVRRQRCSRLSWIGEQAEHGCATEGGCTGHKALRDELASGFRS